jgi:translocation and assembly module TamA
MLLTAALAQAQSLPMPADTGSRASAQGGFEVQIVAPQDVLELLQRHLELLRYRGLSDIDDGELDRLARAAEYNARTLLGTLGYFSPDITVRLHAADSAGKPMRVVIVTAQPGPATRVTEVAITFAGDATTLAQAAPQREAIRNTWSLPAGMRFTQARWDDAKTQALRQLGALHFPNAQVAASRADIDPDTQTARLSVTLDSGPAHRFGMLRIEGLRHFDADLVQRIARLTPGAPYDQVQLLEAQQRLQDSGYFDSAFMSLESGGAPDFAPVLVTLREASRNKLVLGVGASTDSGARVSVEHTNHQLPLIGWRAVSKLLLDRDNQLVGTALTSTPDAGNWRWLTSAQLKHDNASDVKVQSQNLRAGRTKNTDAIDRNYFVEYDRARSDDAGQITRAQSIGASYAWTLRYFDGLPFPSRGYGLGAELGAGLTLGDRRAPFLRLQTHWLGVWPLSASAGRFTARAQGGAVLARDSAVLPSTQLFLTGGDATVRGYAYHDIGKVSTTGQTTAGRFMVNGSVEWQRPIRIDGQASDWESAVFIDGGSVADRPGDFRAKIGIGAGARWKSPVGPLQMDLAYGLAARRLRLHLSVGFTF